tara:strand:+ start:1091 stop:1387 length:297 start_codon:yes stop_codon:yes gene_type:complete
MANNIQIIKAIVAINPDAKVSVNGNDYDQIDWGTTSVISKSDIDAKIVELQADYDSKQYQRDRQPEYPSIADQLDDIYHNGIDGWKTTIKAVKDKYPK